MMMTAKLIRNGSSQAVLLPNEYRFDGEEVYINKIGNMVVLIPNDDPWQTLLDSSGYQQHPGIQTQPRL
jgi:antitoxin VapB